MISGFQKEETMDKATTNLTIKTIQKSLDNFIQSSLHKFFFVDPWKELYDNVGQYSHFVISNKSTIPDLIIYNKTFNKNECFVGVNNKKMNKFPRKRFILRPKYRKEYNPQDTLCDKEMITQTFKVIHKGERDDSYESELIKEQLKRYQIVSCKSNDDIISNKDLRDERVVVNCESVEGDKLLDKLEEMLNKGNNNKIQQQIKQEEVCDVNDFFNKYDCKGNTIPQIEIQVQHEHKQTNQQHINTNIITNYDLPSQQYATTQSNSNTTNQTIYQPYQQHIQPQSPFPNMNILSLHSKQYQTQSNMNTLTIETKDDLALIQKNKTNYGMIELFGTEKDEENEDDPMMNDFHTDYSLINPIVFLENPALIIKKNIVDPKWFIMKDNKIIGNYNSEELLFFLNEKLNDPQYLETIWINDYNTDLAFKPKNLHEILKEKVPGLKRRYLKAKMGLNTKKPKA